MSEDGPADIARDAARRALGALLVDADVTSAHALQGGPVEVTRRGRKERLGVALPEELWAAFDALGARERRVELRVDGHPLHVALSSSGALLLYLEKRPALQVQLSMLVEEGVLPADVAPELVALARSGHGLVVVGPARAGADRVAIAVAHAASESAAVMALDDELAADWLLPSPAGYPTLSERARACVTAGAEVLFALSLSHDDVRALAALELPTTLIASVRTASAAAYSAGFRRTAPKTPPLDADALASQLCVVGRAPGGRPMLVEHHAPQTARSLGASASEAMSTRDDAGVLLPAARARGLESDRQAPPRPAPPRAPLPRPLVEDAELPPLPPLPGGPPAGWASASPEDDPGWELGDAASPPLGEEPAPPRAGPSAFDTMMSQVKARPTFTPRPPPAHPQTRALMGDPFGGLSFEPPGGTLDDVPDQEPPAEGGVDDEEER